MNFYKNKYSLYIDRKIYVVYLFTHLFINFVKGATLDNKPPNVIIIMADDMGFNDVSFHGSNQFLTPNIDALAYHGVILNNHYTAPLCTPSRSSFMTGKYPFNIGMQHLVIISDEPWGLPLNEKLLPQYFKEAGYSTHLVGKWHLGFYKEVYSPTHRGFDSHFGYLGPHIDYYTHRIWYADREYEHALDMRSNLEVNYTVEGRYATNLLTSAAIDVIDNHKGDKPLFLMLNHLAPHAGNEDDPFQAPEEEKQKFSYIKDPNRRNLAAVLSILDSEIGRLMQKLEEKNLLENSIVVFFSDNGAPSEGIHGNAGSNFPFRGQKNTPFDGGAKTPALIWSPLLKSPNRVFDGLFHVSDWLPTLLHASGFPVNLSSIDGVNQWDSISTNSPPKRHELAINIDEKFGYSAIIADQFKLVNGTIFKGTYDHWMGNLNLSEATNLDYSQSILDSVTFKILQNHSESIPNIAATRENSIVRCPLTTGRNCDPLVAPCLFDLHQDPCERNNLAAMKPHKLSQLLGRVKEYQRKMVPLGNKPLDPISNPIYRNNTWGWWVATTNEDRQILENVRNSVKLEIDLIRRQTFGLKQWITTAILITLTGLCLAFYCVCSAYRKNRYRREVNL